MPRKTKHNGKKNIFDINEILSHKPIDENFFNLIVNYLLMKDRQYIEALVNSEDDKTPVIVKLIAAMILRSLDRGSIMQPNILLERLFGKPFTKDAQYENIPKNVTIRLIDDDGNASPI